MREPGPDRSTRITIANDFGLGEAVFGLLGGFVLSVIAVSTFDTLSGHGAHPSTYGQDIASLLGLWVGLVGATLVALKGRAPTAEGSSGGRALISALSERYGLRIRPWPDLLLGIVVGIGGQLVLVPVLDLPLVPFVPHLSERLGAPARTLTAHVSGPGLVVLGLLVCLGSPFIEELFFRGLLLRALLGRFSGLGPSLSATGAIVSTGVLFGLVHFEALQLIALIGFGIVLGALAYRTGRLGPGIIAHIAFNSTTFIALAWTH